MATQPNDPIRRSPGRIALWFLVLALPLAGAFLATERHIERLEEEGKMNVMRNREAQYLQQQSQLVQYILGYIKNDTRFLAHLSPMADVLRGRPDDLVDQIFLSMASTYGNYDQIRLLSASGDEVIRVNYDGGSPRIVDRGELQNKAGRYYFSDAMAVSPDLIAMSPLDLNIEHGEVEVPHKPMIRISAPIDDGDARLGVLVMNFLGKRLLDLMELLHISSNASVGLLNQEGYWLKGLDPDDSWGFMFPDRLDRTIFNAMPGEAAKIYAQEAGQFQTKLGLVSFATIRPLEHQEGIASRGLEFWKIISLLPAESIGASLSQVRRQHVLSSWMITAAILLAALAVAVFLEERRVLDQRILRESLVDGMTGTWNRRYMAGYVSERSSQTMSLALVDLGNFKKVNDRLGHDVGDRVLRQVAEIFQRGVRPQDRVSRHGGDEFLLVFPGTDTAEAEKVMARLAEAVRREVLPDDPVTVEADWGVAQVAEGRSMDEATAEADQRMYAYKKARKERQGITGR